MKDLISQEIEKNEKYISENGLEKFFSKSKYLPKPWEMYKSEFEKFSSTMLSIMVNESKDLFEDWMFILFKKFILPELRRNFNKYYTNCEIIIKTEEKFGVTFNRISYGKKTSVYNIMEGDVKELIRDLFVLSNGFVIPMLEMYRKRYEFTKEEYAILKRTFRSGKKVKEKEAYIKITRYMIEDDLTAPQACKKVYKKTGTKINAGSYNRWKPGSTHDMIVEGILNQESDEELLNYFT